MAERDRIARYFAPLACGEPGAFGLTDDAALLTPPPGKSLVITTDSVIEGIHVLAHATAQHYAQKLVRRNLSDLAAMGASAWRYTLNLHTPSGLDDGWFAAWADALAQEQELFGCVLAGGDSTSGGSLIHTTATFFGVIDGAPLRRSGAGIGDDVYVSGTLGDAAFALAQLQHQRPLSDALAARYHTPTPRLALGEKLRGLATSAIDISDGLLADAAQLCRASQCGMVLEQQALPLSPTLQTHPHGYAYAQSGGDDYELLFTAPVTARGTLAELARALALPLTRIGRVTTGEACLLHDAKGTPCAPTETGWEHG